MKSTINNLIFLKILLIVIICLPLSTLSISIKIKFNHKDQSKKTKSENLFPILGLSTPPSLFPIKIIHTNSHIAVTHPITNIPSFLPSPRVITTTILKNPNTDHDYNLNKDHNLNNNSNNSYHKSKYIECVLKEGHLTLAKTSLSEGGLSSLGDEALPVKIILNTQNFSVFYSGDVEILKINLNELESAEKSNTNQKCFKIFDSFTNIYKFCAENSEISDEWINDIVKFKTECGRNKNEHNLEEAHNDFTENHYEHNREQNIENNTFENKNPSSPSRDKITRNLNMSNRISTPQENITTGKKSDETSDNKLNQGIQGNQGDEKTPSETNKLPHQCNNQTNINDARTSNNPQGSIQDESMMRNFISTANKLLTEISKSNLEKNHRKDEDERSKDETKKENPKKHEEEDDEDDKPHKEAKRNNINYSKESENEQYKDNSEKDSKKYSNKSRKPNGREEIVPRPTTHRKKRISNIPHRLASDEDEGEPSSQKDNPDDEIKSDQSELDNSNPRVNPEIKRIPYPKVIQPEVNATPINNNPQPCNCESNKDCCNKLKEVDKEFDEKLRKFFNKQNTHSKKLMKALKTLSKLEEKSETGKENKPIQDQEKTQVSKGIDLGNYINEVVDQKLNSRSNPIPVPRIDQGLSNSRSGINASPVSPLLPVLQGVNNSQQPQQTTQVPQATPQLNLNKNSQPGMNPYQNNVLQTYPQNTPYLNNIAPNTPYQNNFQTPMQSYTQMLPYSASETNTNPYQMNQQFRSSNQLPLNSNLQAGNINQQIKPDLQNNPSGNNLSYTPNNNPLGNSQTYPNLNQQNNNNNIPRPQYQNNNSLPPNNFQPNLNQSQNQNSSNNNAQTAPIQISDKIDNLADNQKVAQRNRVNEPLNNHESSRNNHEANSKYMSNQQSPSNNSSNSNQNNNESRGRTDNNQNPEKNYSNNTGNQNESEPNNSNNSINNSDDGQSANQANPGNQDSEIEESQKNIPNDNSNTNTNISSQNPSSNDDSNLNTSSGNDSPQSDQSQVENGRTTTTTVKRTRRIIKHDPEGNKIVKHITTVKTSPLKNNNQNNSGQQSESNSNTQNSEKNSNDTSKISQQNKGVVNTQNNKNEQAPSNQNTNQPQSDSVMPEKKYENNNHKLLKPLGGLPARARDSQSESKNLKQNQSNNHHLTNRNQVSNNSTRIDDSPSQNLNSSNNTLSKTSSTSSTYTTSRKSSTSQQNNQTDSKYEEVNIDICFTKDKISMLDYWRNQITRQELKHYVLTSDNFCHICCRNELDESSLDLRCCKERCEIQQGQQSHVSFECVDHHTEMNKRGLSTPRPFADPKDSYYDKRYESVLTHPTYPTLMAHHPTHFVTIKPEVYVPKPLYPARYMLGHY